jgi:hypothetical protein
MTDSRLLHSFDLMAVLISHNEIPVSLSLNHHSLDNDDDDKKSLSVVHCQISSNSFFYTTFLGELASSSQFAKIFSQLLTQLINNSRPKATRKRLQYIFSSIRQHENFIYLKVYDKINEHEECINRHW